MGHNGILLIENNSSQQTLEIGVSGVGAFILCPTAVIEVTEGAEVVPSTTLHLFGDESEAATGTITKWDWSVDQPLGSQSPFIPSNTFPNPAFEVHVHGTYTFYLTVFDEQNIPSCSPATQEVAVLSPSGIRIELLWDTPQDPDQTDEGPEAGADLDLHFTHPLAEGPDLDQDGLPDPWFSDPFDCFWYNPDPEWGSPSPEAGDDPMMLVNDTSGAGPEVIQLHLPESEPYRVGVHYWNDHGFGKSYATVRVYIDSDLVYEAPDVALVDSDLWDVCIIDGETGTVQAVSNTDGTPKISPDYYNPFFFPD